MNDIAVIIPVYNGSDTLASCIESVMLSGARISEIIVVDDGSTDDTLAVANSLASANPKISVIHTECCGSYAARLMGVRAAKAGYIAFLDVDDRYLAGSLDMLADLLDTFDADIAMGKAKELCAARAEASPAGSEGSHASPCIRKPEEIWPRIMKWKTQEFLMYIWNKLYRKELFAQLPELRGIRQGDDVILTCGVFLKAKKIVETPAPVCMYHVNPTGLTHKDFSETDLDLIRVWDEVVNMVDAEPPEELTKAGMTPGLAEMARYNRWRTDFTLICRLILTDNRETDRRFAKDLLAWRAGLNSHWKDLLQPHAMPLNRELLVIALRFFFLPTKALMRLVKRMLRIETGVLLHSGEKL